MLACVAVIELNESPQRHRLVGWLVVLKIYVALAMISHIATWKQGITNF